MFTRIDMSVNRLGKRRFQLFRPSVQIAPPMREPASELDHRNERSDVLGEPVAVDTEINVCDARANPPPPFESVLIAHMLPKSLNLRSRSARPYPRVWVRGVATVEKGATDHQSILTQLNRSQSNNPPSRMHGMA